MSDLEGMSQNIRESQLPGESDGSFNMSAESVFPLNTSEHEPEFSSNKSLSGRQVAWRRFKSHRLAMISLIFLVLLVIVVSFANLIAPYGYQVQNLHQLLKGPSLAHWMGTDNLGRDEFSRLLYAGRISLLVGLTVSLSSGIIGTLVGAIAGYYGRWIDNLLMRVTDLFLTVPLLVVLIIGSTLLSGGVLGIIIILSLFFWMYAARIVRGVFMSLKEQEFVESARSIGSSHLRIIVLQILPNAFGPILVCMTLGVAQAILTESSLSFLGFGIQPPTPSWGNMLNDAQDYFQSAPWLLLAPGIAILLTVLAVNFVGDGLRDALDPMQTPHRLKSQVPEAMAEIEGGYDEATA